MRKAVGLFSGGLDSTLAALLVARQGIKVVGVHFLSPFWKKSTHVLKNALKFGFEVLEVELPEEYLEMLRDPVYGYGKNCNPCIDCKIFMLREARKIMEKVGASFVFTGEVVGQRPKSQLFWSLRVIERDSGLEGLLLRPLSAKLLPPTIPEREGLVDREKLLDIYGRSRKVQFKLAEEWGVEDFSSPAGGCLLTDAVFCARLRRLMQEKIFFSFQDVELLKLGRHFAMSDTFRLVVGRNQKENQRIMSFYEEGDFLFLPRGSKGPVGLGRGKPKSGDVQQAAALVARYCDQKGKALRVNVLSDEGEFSLLVSALSDELIAPYRI
ncbi:MAG: tRNA-uridine 2-sulfurtransferase [Candidatus Atribacteria bacterium]|uniref:tRNA 4-thiouridine(8) synthase ThiI n=1 Tax=Thermatribacter velox TaxID=3039681 RepID=A0ABZ2YB63_9BACT|nr:tRNA-uridine 2-sulfurtransferase [Candidatus Atribacteria bacterium]